MVRTRRMAWNSAGCIKADRVDDDDGRERRMGQQPEERREQQHRGGRDTGGHERRRLSRPPVARTTAVCDVPPPAGIAPRARRRGSPTPVATSSRFASIGGSPLTAKARPPQSSR